MSSTEFEAALNAASASVAIDESDLIGTDAETIARSREIRRKIAAELPQRGETANDRYQRERLQARAEADRQAREVAKREREQERRSVDWQKWYALMDERIDERIDVWMRAWFEAASDGADDEGINPVLSMVGEVIGQTQKKLRGEFAKAIADLRAEMADKLVTLREHVVDRALDRPSPAADQDRIDRAVERAAAQLRSEFGDKVGALERGFEARLADLEGRLKVPGEMPIAKVWAPDSAALVGELCTHAGSLWQARQNTGQTPGGDHWLCLARGGEVIEGDAAGALEQRFTDTRREIRAEVTEEQARTVNRVEAMIAAAEGRMVDALASRPAFDPRQTDRAIETAVGRVHEESDRALEAHKREFAVQLQALKERLGDEVSRRSSDEGHIERAAAAAAEIAVARLRVGLNDVVEARARAFDGRFADLEAQRREFAVQLQGVKERIGDVARQPAFDQGQIEHVPAAAAEIAVARVRVGLDDALEARRRAFDAQLAGLEARLKGVPGRLPVAKTWSEGLVVYQGEIVTFGGECWQACCDTAKQPGDGGDWKLVAARGRDGSNGKSLLVRGVFDLQDSYAVGDVISYEGQGYLAMRDNPTGLPGDSDGWLLIAARGAKGERGEPGKVGQHGHKGDRGPASAKIEEWRLSRENFAAVPFYTDGTSGPPLRLRDLFQEFIDQTG